MDNIAVIRLMRLIKTLSVENKLEILSKLSESLKADFGSIENKKEELLNELFGAWSHMSDELSSDIIKNRSNSDREISFD